MFDNSFYGTGNFGGWQVSVGTQPQYPTPQPGVWGGGSTGGVYTGGVQWPGQPVPDSSNQLLLLVLIGVVIFMAAK